MKRLLFAPLLIAGLQFPTNAIPWGGDIVVQTDLGEKYIVKKSAVTVTPFTKEDLILLRDSYTPVDFCKERLMPKSYLITNAFCRENYKRGLEKEMWVEHDKDIETLKKSNLNMVAKEVRFRDIFIDLNGNKNPGSYKTVLCLNAKGIIASFPDETDRVPYLDALIRAKVMDKTPNSKSNLAIEAVKYKVCDKYAKF